MIVPLIVCIQIHIVEVHKSEMNCRILSSTPSLSNSCLLVLRNMCDIYYE